MYLDGKVGKGNYVLFLSADHGAAHNPQYLMDENVPAGFISEQMQKDLNAYLKSKYGKENIIAHFLNYQLTLNDTLLATLSVPEEKVKGDIVKWLGMRPEVSYAIDMEHIDNTPLPEPLRTMCINGYNRQRSGHIQVILKPGWFENDGSSKTGTTHGTWNPYDAHIPLIWYGWNVPKGETHRVVNMTDISATLAALLHIQMPNGCIGQPITELLDKK